MSVREDTALYYCKHNLSCVCKARIKVNATGEFVMVLADSHTEICVAKLKKTAVYVAHHENMCAVVYEYMKGRAELMSVEYMSMLSSNNWKMLKKEVSEKYSVWSGISDTQMKAI